MTRRRGERRSVIVGWIAAAIFVGTLLAAAAARFVPPETLWLLQALSLVLLPILGGLLVFALAAGWRRHWGLAAFSVLPVVLVLALPMLTTERAKSPTAEAVSEAAPLKVISFNAKPESIAQGEAGFQKLLEEEQPHLVALQEFPLRVFPSGQVGGSRLVVPFLKELAYQVTRPDLHYTVNIARPIFSRIDSVGAVEFLPDSFGQIREGIWTSGGLTRVLYRWEGTTIAVYNIHLHSFSRPRLWKEGWRGLISLAAWTEALRSYRNDFTTRAEQARTIRRLIDAESHPFLVFGDFNSTPGTWVYAHLSRGLTDVFANVGSGWGMTFPAWSPFIRIDFILASKEWEVVDAHVSKTVVSDHIPVVATLLLRYPLQLHTEREGDNGVGQ